MGLVTVVVLCWTSSALAGGSKPPKPTKAQQCQAAKNQAAGEKAECLAEAWAKAALGKTPDFAKCEQAFTNAFAKAEQKAGPGVCPTEGDAVAIEELVDACMADVADALAGMPPVPCGNFPATGADGLLGQQRGRHLVRRDGPGWRHSGRGRAELRG